MNLEARKPEKEIRFDESFNWLAVLKDLAAGMPISRGQHGELIDLAGNWPTCACGQLCAALPRLQDGCPADDETAWLGVGFFQQVRHARWSEALRTFHRIEARTEELLLLKNWRDEFGSQKTRKRKR
ncbi:MAG TPA: hypothetical protein VHW03_10075 [Chthoniobacterales bacterium]|jgi:hypothetical protein|nr:hypothetical protein [Chthoniobacterales bacterium]